MIPVRDDNPSVMVPFTTFAIIAANCAAWFYLQGMGMEPSLSDSVCRYAVVPGDILGSLPPGTVFPVSADATCQTGPGPAFHTLLTSMFMHGGWFHLLGNMWFLWIFGNNVEDAMGHFRFAVFYLLCGLGATGAQLAFSQDSAIPMVGASGAIGGVMGAYILLYPRVQVHLLLILGFFVTTVAVPAVFMLGYWFLLQLLGGFSSIAGQGGVAFWAHAGGFAAGALLIFGFRKRALLERHPYYGWRKPSPHRNWERLRPEDRQWRDL